MCAKLHLRVCWWQTNYITPFRLLVMWCFQSGSYCFHRWTACADFSLQWPVTDKSCLVFSVSYVIRRYPCTADWLSAEHTTELLSTSFWSLNDFNLRSVWQGALTTVGVHSCGTTSCSRTCPPQSRPKRLDSPHLGWIRRLSLRWTKEGKRESLSNLRNSWGVSCSQA